MPHVFRRLKKIIIVLFFLGIGSMVVIVAYDQQARAMGRSDRMRGPVQTLQPTATPLATPAPVTGGNFFSPEEIVAMIGAAGAVLGACIAGGFALLVSMRKKREERASLQAQSEHQTELQDKQQAEAERQRLQHEQDVQIRVQRYCQKLQENPGIARLQILGMSHALNIEDVYVRLRIHPDSTLSYEIDPELREAEEAGDPNALMHIVQQNLDRRMDSALDPVEAIRKRKHCVIVGDPGAGKTTLLKYLTLKSARGQLSDLPHLPIYIELSKFDPARYPDLIALAARRWQEYDAIPEADANAYIREKLDAGNILLLLDGLDETIIGASKEQAEKSYAYTIEAIKKIVESYPQAPIVVTVRKAGYSSQYRAKLAGFDELEIVDFRPEDIKHFVRNWFTSSQTPEEEKERKIRDLTTRLERNTRIQTLASNPLLLSLIVLVYENHLDLPERRTELYKRCVEALLTQWDATRNVLRRREFGPDDKQSLLKEIAWHFHKQGKRYFPIDELLTVIKDFLPAIRLAPERNQDVLEEIARENGLLREQAQGWYGFSHVTFQEYFVTCYVVDYSLLNVVLEHPGHPWWEEVLLLYAGLAPDASSLLSTLLGHNANLQLQEDMFHTNLIVAGQCLGTRPIVRETRLRGEIIEQLFEMLRTTPYALLQENSAKTLALIGGEEVNRRLLHLLAFDNQLDLDVREHIAYALGASGERGLAHDLASLLADKQVDRYVRARIARTLGDLAERGVKDKLLDLLSNEQEDWYVRQSIAAALGKLGDPSVVPALMALLSSKNSTSAVYQSIAITLGSLGDCQVVPTLRRLLLDEQTDSYVRGSVANALATLEGERMIPTFLQLLADEQVERYVRQRIAKALATMERSIIPEQQLLGLFMNDRIDEEVRISIAETLCALQLPVAQHVLRLLGNKQAGEKLRASMATILGCLNDHTVLPKLHTLLQNQQLENDVRGCIVATLGHLGESDVLTELLDLLAGRSNRLVSQDVRLEIARALGKLARQSILYKQKIIQDLVALLSDQQIDRYIRQEIVTVLSQTGTREVVPDLIQLLARQDIDHYVRWSIAHEIARLAQNKEVIDALVSLLKDVNIINNVEIINEVYRALWTISHRAKVRIVTTTVAGMKQIEVLAL